MFVSFRILHGKTLLLIHEIINYCLVRNISSSVYGNFGNGNSRWFISESYWADCIGNFKFISSPLNAKSFSDKVFPPAVNCTRISADRKSSGKLNWIQFASLPTKIFNESVWFGNGLPRRFIRKSKKLFFRFSSSPQIYIASDFITSAAVCHAHRVQLFVSTHEAMIKTITCGGDDC